MKRKTLTTRSSTTKSVRASSASSASTRKSCGLDPTGTTTTRRWMDKQILKVTSRLKGSLLSQLTNNVFCATGPGGGVDATCGREHEASIAMLTPLVSKNFGLHGKLTNAEHASAWAKLVEAGYSVVDGKITHTGAVSGFENTRRIGMNIGKHELLPIKELPIKEDTSYVKLKKAEDFKQWHADSIIKKPVFRAAHTAEHAGVTFVTLDRYEAADYQAEFGGKMHGGYVSIKNPLDLRKAINMHKLVEVAKAAGIDDIVYDKQTQAFSSKSTDKFGIGGLSEDLPANLVYHAPVRKALEKLGYDSVRLKATMSENTGADEIAVFHAHQLRMQELKSPTANVFIANASFESWLKQQFKGLTGKKLWQAYIERGYKKGAKGKVSIERLKKLVADAQANIEAESTKQQALIVRALADGLVAGEHPSVVAKRLVKLADVAEYKARTIARTELMRAHSEGQLDEMEASGVEEVGVNVEWTATKGMCKLCADLDGMVFKLKDARGKLPRHPNCRCAWRPVVDKKPVSSKVAMKLTSNTARDAVDALRFSPLDALDSVRNVFCSTGKGGGVDPTCSAGKGAAHGYTGPAASMSGMGFKHDQLLKIQNGNPDFQKTKHIHLPLSATEAQVAAVKSAFPGFTVKKKSLAGLHKVAAPAPAPAAPAKPAAPATSAAPSHTFPADIAGSMSSAVPIGKGSTGAKSFEHNGKKYSLKDGANKEQILNEHFATKAMQAMGVPVPDSMLINGAKVSPWIQGPTVGSKMHEPDVKEQVKSHLVAHALLNNWDALGMHNDNAVVDPHGKVHYIDLGGSFNINATGTAKKPWSDDIHTTMQNMIKFGGGSGPNNPYKELTNYDVHKQIKHIVQHADAIVAAAGPHGAKIKQGIEQLQKWTMDMHIGQAGGMDLKQDGNLPYFKQASTPAPAPAPVPKAPTHTAASLAVGHHLGATAKAAGLTPVQYGKVLGHNPDPNASTIVLPKSLKAHQVAAFKAAHPTKKIVQKVLKKPGQMPSLVSKKPVKKPAKKLGSSMSGNHATEGLEPMFKDHAAEVNHGPGTGNIKLISSGKPAQMKESMLTPGESDAVSSWKGSPVHMRKSFAASRGDFTKLDKDAKNILSAMMKMPDHEGTLFRSLNSTFYAQKVLAEAKAAMAAGGHWSDPAPHGMSPNAWKSLEFSGGGVVLVVKAKTAKSIAGVHNYGTESEILGQPNTKYKVTHIDENANVAYVSSAGQSKQTKKTVIHLEEV